MAKHLKCTCQVGEDLREAVLDGKSTAVRDILKHFPHSINWVSTCKTSQLKGEVICVHGNTVEISQIRWPLGNALHAAFDRATSDNLEILEALIRHSKQCPRPHIAEVLSGDVDGEAARAPHNTEDKYGLVPVFYARCPEAVERYLSSGIENKVLESAECGTLLHECTKKSILSPAIIKALRYQVDSLDGNGKTPIFYLTENLGARGAFDEVYLWLKKLEMLKLELGYGSSLLHQCVDTVEEEIVIPSLIEALTFLQKLNNRRKISKLLSANVKMLVDGKLDHLKSELHKAWTFLHGCSCKTQDNSSDQILHNIRNSLLNHHVSCQDGRPRHLMDYLGGKNSLSEKLTAAAIQLNWDAGDASNNSNASPPLAMACEKQNFELVDWLLKVPGILDHETYDGLTGFSISLAMENHDIVMAFLHSGIKSHQHNLFLAKEYLEVSSVKNSRLHQALSDFIESETVKDGQLNPHCKTRDKSLIKMLQKYPLVHSECEKESLYQCPNEFRMSAKCEDTKISTYHVDQCLLRDFCISKGGRREDVWILDKIKLKPCQHEMPRKVHCTIIHDMLVVVKRLENKLNHVDSPLHRLKPRFILIGSIPEGTRIGVANEMDLMMEFAGLSDCPFGTNLEDPYHLYKTKLFPAWMSSYFNSSGHFLHGMFRLHLLNAIDFSISEVLKDNPTRLKAYTQNKDYKNENCEQCRKNLKHESKTSLFTQCIQCKVTTSQTKVGICLQLAWNHEECFMYNSMSMEKRQDGFKIYTSIDLVPVFDTYPIPIRTFARAVNKDMLQEGHPKEWYDHQRKYLSHDKILVGLGQEDEVVTKVLLKMINCQAKHSYLIKAAQHLTCGKFQSEELKKAFCQIKVLRQAFGIEQPSSYLLKKTLAMPEFLRIELEALLFNDHEDILLEVLSSPHLKHYFAPHIDFDKYSSQMHRMWIPILTSDDSIELDNA